MAVLELKDVHYTYPGFSQKVLNDVSFKLETGSITALLGCNASGKSTLARIAARLLKPDSGEVVISDESSRSNNFKVGLLFQNPDEQLLTADVESELAWGLENLAVAQDEMRERIKETLKKFGLTDIAKRPPDTLSDGWKQITALAALVAMKPAFLILDEATAFLDPYWTGMLKELSRDLTIEMGLLWITASAIEAAWADKVMIIKEGHIVGEGEPEIILHPERIRTFGMDPLPEWAWDSIERKKTN